MAQGQRAKGEVAEDVELVGGLSSAGRQTIQWGEDPTRLRQSGMVGS